jgi:hypothetical protein
MSRLTSDLSPMTYVLNPDMSRVTLFRRTHPASSSPQVSACSRRRQILVNLRHGGPLPSTDATIRPLREKQIGLFLRMGKVAGKGSEFCLRCEAVALATTTNR